MRYILIWRRSPTSRYIDVELNSDDTFKISEERNESVRLLGTEAELVAYINGTDTEECQVDAQLAHQVLGWTL